MPEISRFLGIIIAMFYDEHNPPHFHVRYGEYKAEIGFGHYRYWRENCRHVSWDWLWNGPASIKTNSWRIGNWHSNRQN
jgi:hypothetical protein